MSFWERMTTMNRFIRTFAGWRSVAETAEAANAYAEEEKLIIVSAALAFSGAGRTYEDPVMTVVYERNEMKVRKPRKKAKDDGENIVQGD